MLEVGTGARGRHFGSGVSEKTREAVGWGEGRSGGRREGGGGGERGGEAFGFPLKKLQEGVTPKGVPSEKNGTPHRARRVRMSAESVPSCGSEQPPQQQRSGEAGAVVPKPKPNESARGDRFSTSGKRLVSLELVITHLEDLPWLLWVVTLAITHSQYSVCSSK